jgi:CrcB protein
VTTLWIALGGALGSAARYHVGLWVGARDEGALPVGTLVVNLVGSLLLGVLLAITAQGDDISPNVRLALGTGVLGGFTTYSAFNAETIALAQRGAWTTAATYVAVTLVGALVLGWLGWHGGRTLAGG